MKRYLRHPSFAIGAVLLVVVLMASVVGMVTTPHDPTALDPLARLESPSWSHPFGTDQFGRDIFSRILAGGHLTLATGLFAVFLGLVVGGTVGCLAGYFGRAVDLGAVAFMDILLAFPAVLLALGIVAILGGSVTNVIIAVGVATVPVFARVARASVLSVLVRPYVKAAVAMGCSHRRILLRHVLPNILGPMLVLTTTTIATAILIGSALSFLGLGAAPPTPEWGVMLSDARAYMRLGWWLTVVPGVAVALVVLALNLLGDGLRDLIDPTSRPGGD
ncbi:ABC transporter permease [Dactylosporangium sp. AC04546]|uniref:ABC transporter permease n=1 Tax=Dactylosporangium sp. AC04546 TaxID=2862460 RepID=UPI001EDD03A9|nr:ABC transporter permease [Dactylosporangium sp. AC04546]WVK86808.1 ABC transporter permease [Dactylosporangium sp. AC04546]